MKIMEIVAATALLGVTAVMTACDASKQTAKDNANMDGKQSSVINPAAKVDPQEESILNELATLGGKPIETLSADEARKQPAPTDAVKSLLKKRGQSTEPEPVQKVEDRTISGPGGPIPIRIYWPNGTGPFPILLFVHGGGWVIATNDTYDASARALTNKAGYIVVSPEYRKAPEHPFPASHQDVWAAYEWTLKNGSAINGDSTRVAVGGESAGGNMAAEVAIMARDQKRQMPIHQLLIYPVIDNNMDTASYRENAAAKPLSKAMMAWFSKQEAGPDSENFLPMRVRDLSRLPSATVITAEIDPLRSEGEQYAEKLKAAGVNVEAKTFDGVAHEFFGQGAILDKAKEAVEMAASRLRDAARARKEPAVK